MCEICRRFICPPSCPSYEGRNAEYGKRRGVCARCGAELYAGEIGIIRGRKYLCEDCLGIERRSAEKRKAVRA